MNGPIPAGGEAMPMKANSTDCPRMDVSAIDTHALCQLYRILDNIEETANMAHQYLHHVNGTDTAASAYINDQQEFISAERFDIVEELRQRPCSDDDDGQRRLCVIIQYEAWCEEFAAGTLQQLSTSTLATEAL